MRPVEWWRSRADREKLILSVGAAALVMIILFLIVDPVIQERQRLSAEIPALEEDLEWMRENAAEIRKLRDGAGMPAGAGGQGFSLALAESILRNAGLEKSVTELRPLAGQGIRLTFGEVEYGVLMEFLHQLQVMSGARITEARFVRLDDKPGMVEATLALAPGS